MLSGLRPNNAHRDPSGKMGYNLAIKRSSKPQQNSKIVKESVLPTQAKQSLTHQEKLKAKRCIHKPNCDLPLEEKQQANDGNLVHRKTPANSQQLSVMFKATKDDELVRYMSNLPGYLQRVEKTENIQDKALNVGVLDWGRLENWKCNQKDAPFGVGNNSSLPFGKLSAARSSISNSPTRNGYASKKHPSSSCKTNSSRDGGISRNAKSSLRDSRFSQDVENASTSHFDEQKRAAWKYRSFDRNSSDTTSENGNRRELCRKITSNVKHQPSNSKYDGMPIGSKESVSAYIREAKQSVEQLQRSDIKGKASEQNFTPGIGSSSSELRNYDSSPGTKEKKIVNDSGTKKRIESHEPEFDRTPQHEVDDKKNIVLLVPRKIAQNSSQKQPRMSLDENVTATRPRKLSQNSSQKQPRMSLDENVTATNWNFFSDGTSDELACLSELNHEIPHSCPLQSSVENGPEQKEMAPDAINTQDAGVSSDATKKSTRGDLEETSNMLEQETAEVAAIKGRHPSPNRRFSFSLSRMTRSFSFKESSAVPRLSPAYVSVKSGPVASNAFAGMDTSNRERVGGHNRARSSPLRRILDPLLLKSKGVTSSNSAETDQPLRRSLSSYSFKPPKAVESLRNEEQEASSIQAQLVLTTSNGLTSFRFMINNNIIVAAPVRNIMPPGKNDTGCNYVFYSVDEIKRKSGSWINQVGKEKKCGFVYNVMGQMKVNSSLSLDLSGKNSNSQYVVKESVLFSVELRHGQASPRLTPSTELAAVVCKMHNRILGCDEQHSDKEANVEEKGFSWGVLENEQHNSCTVILPGGIHSLPKTGVPSSLIHRWKSSGTCDCGGWDIGCKLRIISNESQHQKLLKRSYSHLASDRFELFDQGEAHQDRPIFSMAPFEKGNYSVEFSPSISLTQAIFICVSVISCQRLSDLPKESDGSNESSNTNDGLKTKCTTVPKETPVKYTPCPPVSPVGRA